MWIHVMEFDGCLRESTTLWPSVVYVNSAPGVLAALLSRDS